MRNRVVSLLGLRLTLLLAVSGLAALAGPVIVTIVHVEASEIQAEPAIRNVAAPTRQQTAPIQNTATAQRGNPESAGTTRAIQEYRIREIRVTGGKYLQNDTIRSQLGLVPGEVLNEAQLRRGFEDLHRLYAISGHINFNVDPVFEFVDQLKIVDLVVHIDEGPQYTVNRIRITGNATTPEDVIRREILIKDGDVFNVSLWDLSKLRLSQLGLFEVITIEDTRIRPSSPSEPKLDIELRLREKAR